MATVGGLAESSTRSSVPPAEATEAGRVWTLVEAGARIGGAHDEAVRSAHGETDKDLLENAAYTLNRQSSDSGWTPRHYCKKNEGQPAWGSSDSFPYKSRLAQHPRQTLPTIWRDT